MSAPTALYRRYRPDSFADVIGQEHVTAPLMAALDKNRVNHAYLFSGPRGCGKTTSARILARCLNCAQGPTSHPCGTCDSCVELARGGPGSLDVIEIDAASHGGVDDARDLRERATFAPIRDRYKIFIIDEAHMVTSAGFNALLKIVEEPPEHIKFIFATTEPDKVIGTIRSRTHHYPFRLVPPEPLMAYLAHLCEQEQVAVAPGVLSLVIRAGGGSVRDSLSVLDQLMAGAGASGLDYELAVDLLGYTHASLLDDVVEALAAGDSATVFKSVDRVIQTGHDPRRFVEDLLERFRDLIIVAAMPESAHAILRGTPDELIARMQTQAAQLGAAELSRAADVTNAAFNEMTGATSPRLHLELLGARLLLPGADSSARGMAARLDAMERRLNYGGTPGAVTDSPTGVPVPQSSPAPATGTTPAPSSVSPVGSGGGLAAVRAQLAKAKEAAGAEVASRHLADQPAAPAPAAAPAQAAPATTDAFPAPSPAASATWDSLDPAPAAPAQSPSWDDLETAPATPDARAAQDESAAQPTGQASGQQTSGNEPVPATRPAETARAEPARQAQPVETAQPVEAAQPAQAPSPQATVGTSGIEVIRRAWPEILANLANIRKVSWAMANQNVVPQAFDGETLRVGLPSSALIERFTSGGHADNLRQAIHTTLGITCQLVPVTGDAPSHGASAEPNPKGLTDRRPTGAQGSTPSGTTQAAAPSVPTAAPAQKPTRPITQAPVATRPQPTTGAPASAIADTSLAADPAPAQPGPPQAADFAEPASAPEPATEHAPVAGAPEVQHVSAQAEPAPAPVVPSAPAHTAAPTPVTDTPAVQHAAAPSAASADPAPETAVATRLDRAPSGQAARVSEWDGPVPEEPSWDDEPPFDDWAPEPGSPDAGINAVPHEEWAESSTSRPSTPDANGATAPTSDSPHAPESPLDATAKPGASAPVEAAPYRPKVSPISAWTTGWDLPSQATAVPTPATEEPATPRRSQLLAAQAQQTASQDSPQDWGVSLGATSRNRVADPGWGAPDSAPDWAQPAGEPAPAAGTASSQPEPQQPDGQAGGVQAGPAQTGATGPTVGDPAGPAPVEAPDPARAGGGPGVSVETASSLAVESAQQGAPAGKISMYQRLSNSPEAQAGRVQAPTKAPDAPYVEDVPSPDDVTIEESGVVGQAAVERILGGALIEERPLNGGR